MLAGDLQGFPNGRRLADDVLDIELQALEGAAQTGKLVDALAAGDKVDANDNPFGGTFPYVALPNVGAREQGRHGRQRRLAGTGRAARTGRRHHQRGAGRANQSNEDRWLTPLSISATAAILGAVASIATLLLLGWRRRRVTGAVAGPAPHTDLDATRPL